MNTLSCRPMECDQEDSQFLRKYVTIRITSTIITCENKN